MGVEPIEIDSRLVSAQKRRRLYWTNIPNITQPEDRKIFLKDILIERDKLTDFDIPSEARINYILRRASKGWVKKGWNTINTDKAECLTAVSHKNLKEYVYEDEHGLRFLSYIELERLQTVPDDYTNCVSKAHRIEMLGNGWTVDVIVHILSHIPNF
jgi:DNA (cytosine-5)-methyltransferase 3A